MDVETRVDRAPGALEAPNRTPDPVELEGVRKPNLGLRERIPALGLQEYWYPAVGAGSVGRRYPKKVRLLGRNLVFFRGRDGEVVALEDACPHRNSSLSVGKCHYEGTVTCAYHGWTFDGTGECLAVLGEGPESTIPGKASARARSYPTRTLKGLTFVWMGDGEPAPIEEDVPPEFFDDAALIQFSVQDWDCNWRASVENLNDAHVFYVHRNSLELLIQDHDALNALLHIGPTRPRTKIVDGRAVAFDMSHVYDFMDRDTERKRKVEREFQDTYERLGNAKWPKTKARLYIAKASGAVRKAVQPKRDWLLKDDEWGSLALHLPGTFRVDYQSHVYTRAVVPVDRDKTRVFYYQTTYPRSAAQTVLNKIVYHAYYDWKQHKNFSGQDKRVVESCDYDNPHEKLSTSDTFTVAVRRLLADHARRPAAAVSPAAPTAEAECAS